MLALWLFIALVIDSNAFQRPIVSGNCQVSQSLRISISGKNSGVKTTKVTFINKHLINVYSKSGSNDDDKCASESDDDNKQESDDIQQQQSALSSEQSNLLTSLQKRLSELQTQSDALLSRWKNGKCHSNVRITIEQDWVRRIALSKWPFVAVGSASGSLYLANVNTCEIVATVKNVHQPYTTQSADKARELDSMLRKLYGDYDGGGTLALAFKGDIVASAGREGGVKVFRVVNLEDDEIDASSARLPPPSAPSPKSRRARRSLDSDKEKKAKELSSQRKKLVSLGEVASLKGIPCTSLVLDDQDRLWIGCYDGSLHRFDFRTMEPSPGAASDNVAGNSSKPLTLKTDSNIMCLDVADDIGLVVVGLANGTVKMFSAVDGSTLALWSPLISSAQDGKQAFKESAYIRSVHVMPGPDDESWAVVAGTSDGRIFARQLLMDTTTGWVCHRIPFDNIRQTVEFIPGHLTEQGSGAPVLCMTSRQQGGLLITGGQDGTLRVWNCWEEDVSQDDDEEQEEETTSSVTSNKSTYSDYVVQPKVLYNLVGYKVWLGSVCVDEEGLRLISDGSDNACIVHDFSVPMDYDL